MGLIRLSVKVGLAATAVYYLKEEGVWKDSDISLKALDKLKQTSEPYVQQIKAQVPLELPKLPETEEMHQLVGNYWNKGVLASFDFLQNLPGHVTVWTEKGVDMVLQNEDIKKFIEDLSNSSKESVKNK
ncbi:hypothetical protein WA026_011526 [Henosepilachna vigintioctopunctata]|uniref:MICOS complex subunit MIC13 n=1 Tax=Henosepilachna vigintioctopunctata TaxID=420089 RepID=A0AAW1TSG3_9CUCU